MNIQEIKQVILEGLRPFAEANGFTIDENRFGIFSEKPDHTSSIDFLCYTSANGAEIYPYVNIEFPVIHDICRQCGFYLNYTAYMNMFVLEIIKAYNYPAHIDTQPEWLKKFVWHQDLETKMSFAYGNKLTILSDADDNPRYDEIKDTNFSIMTTDRLTINEDIRQSFLRVANYLDGI